METIVTKIEMPAAAARHRLPFNENWRFIKGDHPGTNDSLACENVRKFVIPSGNSFRNESLPSPGPDDSAPSSAYCKIDYDDSDWRRLSLPHDWGIEGPFKQEYPGETGKLPWWGVGWYRKSFTPPAGLDESCFYLDFDGAMSHALVWVNGHFAGGWPYGYASFQIDLTPWVKPGAENVIAVRLENPEESSRWYPGGGIYRNLWLTRTSPIHVGQWGTWITTPVVKPDRATVSIQTTVRNRSSKQVRVEMESKIFALSERGARAASAVVSTGKQIVSLAGDSSETRVASADIPTPALWSVSAPNRYVAITTVARDGKIIDCYETPFGIRAIAFDAQKGFLLNGEPVRLNGVCQHHDLGALGSALHPRALERQIEILREMGVNAIRTSHNPPAPELLDICDRAGLLVIDEAFDAWSISKKPGDYARLFADWHEADLRAFIRRDRNHPCVILWSTGNEIREQGDPAGHEISRRLTAIVKSEDPTRPTTAGCNFPEAAYNGFQETVDVFGFNYKPHEYGRFREKFPHIPCYGSETASTISSRGEYFFPVTDDRAGGQGNFQMSSYDLYAPRWATTPDTEFAGQDRYPFVFGEFVWTGFDYLGEPTPYNADSTVLLNFSDPRERELREKELAEIGKLHVPSRGSYFGIVDLGGFKKDRFYIYQARWRPELPMAHILPHWNWPERLGEITPVHVYTSGDEAELFLNGRSLGRRKKEPFMYRLRWDDVVYEPGELKVIAYKNGEKWAEAVQRATGPAAALRLDADRAKIHGDGKDLSFVTLSIVDENGLVVPRTHNLVEFSVEGPGEILATDNGDATSHEPFQSPRRKAYNGLALAIIRRHAGKGGRITLHAKSPGLRSAAITIEAIDC